jgi:protein TonB
VGAVRYLAALAIAIVVCFGLFLFMHGMVAFAEASLKERGSMGRIDFVRLRRDSAIEKKQRELPQKPTTKQQPEAPKMQMPSVAGPGATSIGVDAPDLDTKVDMKGGLDLGAAPSDTEAVPVVRVDPIYPPLALQRGIEGWVKVMFDIGPSGNVLNPKVVDAEPPRMFEDSALNAVKKWKYKPQVREGKPITTRGNTTKVIFRLEK